MGPYILTRCSTVEEARAAMHQIDLVAVTEPTFGEAPPAHVIITDASGKAIVVEFLKGKTVIFDAPLGVVTNSPTYDWHTTNIRKG